MSNRISVREYCALYEIEEIFLSDIEEYGLMKFDREASVIVISHDQLSELDKIRHWRYDLNINIEGIDVIRRLLEKQSGLISKLHQLEQELRLYR